MSTGHLTIDLAAVAANWRALDALSQCETAAVVKADGYGLGAGAVAKTLAAAGARRFFVAAAEEGTAVRAALGQGPEIYVFSGHMQGDSAVLSAQGLIPMLNDAAQVARHQQHLPGHPFGLQLDTGMNRLGIEPDNWAALRAEGMAERAQLILSQLACADTPDHAMNARQRDCFVEMTQDLTVPRSLAATGGILLGSGYHFDLTRPGVGLYGGLPFEAARPAVQLDLPVIQIRDVAPGETVGYANAWQARRASRIATLAAGYADGLIRAMGPKACVYQGQVACPVVGRVSMDMITVDVTDLSAEPDSLSILNGVNTVDTVAEAAGTIGYEILTSLGHRYDRTYLS